MNVYQISAMHGRVNPKFETTAVQSNAVQSYWDARNEIAQMEHDIPREMAAHSGSEGETTKFTPSFVEQVRKMII